jgi:hypothetical protein
MSCSRTFSRGALAAFLVAVACLAAPVAGAAAQTTITDGPSGPTNIDPPTFHFSNPDTTATFECWYHSPEDVVPAFSSCMSPDTPVNPLGEGEWVFEVRSLTATVPDIEPARRSFTVDTTEPDTSIDSGPPSPTADNTPDFTFSSPESGVTFECSFHRQGEAAAFTGCASPPPSLADGTWIFAVKAVDEAGNPDGSPALWNFTVDATAPDTTIVTGPAGLSNDATPDFAFTSTEGGTFECSLHPIGEAPPAFAPCASPHARGPLADGSYVFEVRAIDDAGNPDVSPTSRVFQVDTTPPQTTITGGPGDTTAATAVFLFSAPGAASLSCRLDGGAWQPCESPQAYSGLSLGAHRFEVTAVDAAGNADPTPAQHAWQVLKPGLVIPAAVKQAVALARELVQLRRALARIRLRALARRRTILFRSFDALTAGTVDIRARARVRQGAKRRWIAVLAGKRDVPGAGRHPVRAKVTKKGRRLARRRRSLPLELRLSFTDLAGRSLWATSKLTLRR